MTQAVANKVELKHESCGDAGRPAILSPAFMPETIVTEFSSGPDGGGE